MQTSTMDLRRELKKAVDSLSKERLRTAADFLRYLQTLESDKATEELIRIPGAIEEIEQGIKDIAAGRTTPVRNLKRKYRDVRRRAG